MEICGLKTKYDIRFYGSHLTKKPVRREGGSGIFGRLSEIRLLYGSCTALARLYTELEGMSEGEVRGGILRVLSERLLFWISGFIIISTARKIGTF